MEKASACETFLTPTLLQNIFHSLVVTVELLAGIWKGIGNLAQDISVSKLMGYTSLNFYWSSDDPPTATTVVKAVSLGREGEKYTMVPFFQ